LVDASVETLDHTVGLRMARRCQPMLGRQGSAGNVESMFAARFLVFGSEAISKLRAVVGQNLASIAFARNKGQLRRGT
jgi:hypothetical protein